MLKRVGLMAALAVGMMGMAAPAMAQFGAFAISTTSTTMAIGLSGHASSPREANQVALLQCRNEGGMGCIIQYRWNGRGCVFATTGRNYQGQNGWGMGATPAAAKASCESNGLLCQRPIHQCNDY